MFEEVDKLSPIPAGEAVANRLMGFLDCLHNDVLSDDFLGELPLRCSGSLVIFTFNKIERFEPALKNRMDVVHTKDLTRQEKEQIWSKCLLPRYCEDEGLAKDAITFNRKGLDRLSELMKADGGARGGAIKLLEFVKFGSYSHDVDTLQLPAFITTDEGDQLMLISRG